MLIKEKILDSVSLMFLIFSTGGLLFVFNRNLMYVLFFVFSLALAFLSSKKPKRNIFNASIFSALTIIFLYSINYFFSVRFQSIDKYLFNFLVALICILLVYHFLNNRSTNKFIKVLHTCLIFIFSHSILNFFAYFFISGNLQTITNAFHECQTFYYFFYYDVVKSSITIFNTEFCRNQGFFWEPGILQSYLNLLFFLEAFFFKKRKILLILIAFTILTTYSTTGLTILLIQIFALIISEIKKKNLSAFIIPLFLIPVFSLYLINLDGKIRGDYQSSFQKRIFDLVQPFFIAIEYPLTGVGLDGTQFLEIRKDFYIKSKKTINFQEKFGIETSLKTSEKGSSNSIMYILATLGFPTTIILLFFLFKQNMINNKKSLFMIIVLLSIMSQPLLIRPFFFLLIVSGMINFYSKFKMEKRL